MLKKFFFIFLFFNLFNHCEYKPLYSNQNKVTYKIIVMNITGDKEINNLITKALKRNSRESSEKILNVSFETKYNKNIIAKNATGTITDYQAIVITKFTIEQDNNIENFSINEKFNFKKMTDKYEEKNYERNIKKNLANTISEKLILRLAVIK